MENEGNSESGNIPPVGQQGIFSTPDLSVNSEKLEEIKPELSEDDKLRIASAFGKTDATRRHDQLSEQGAISGTVIPASNATASTATGDIKIPGVKKKSKAPLLILAAVTVLAAVAGGVWWVMGGEENSDNPASLKTAFNQYANFFLYNSESDNSLEGLYQYGDTYYIGELNSEEQVDAHFAKSEEKYQKFLKAYKQYKEKHPDNNIDANVSEQIETYYEDLDLLRYTKKSPNISANDLLEAFIESPDGLSSQINTYYEPFAGSAVESTRHYGEEYKNQLQILLTAYQIYNVQGCLQEGAISVACRQNDSDEQLLRANEIMQTFQAFYSNAVSVYRSISTSVYEEIWVINLEIEWKSYADGLEWYL